MNLSRSMRMALVLAVFLGGAWAQAGEAESVESVEPTEAVESVEPVEGIEEPTATAREWAAIVSDDPQVIEWVTAWRWESPEAYAAAKAADRAMIAMAAAAGAPDAAGELRDEAVRRLLAVVGEDIPLQARRDALRWVGLLAPGATAPAVARYLEDADLADDARMALERMPAIAATDALMGGMEGAQASVRPAIARALGRRGDVETVETLLPLAQQGSDGLKWAAFDALVSLGIVPPAIFPAAATFEQHEARQYTQGAFIAADALLAMEEYDLAARIYESLAKAPMAPHYICATLTGLADSGSGQVIPHAIAYLGTRGVHETAARVLHDADVPGVDDLLADASAHALPVQQAALLRILAERGAVSLGRAVETAAGSQDPLVRVGAALAAGETPPAILVKRAHEAYPPYFPRLAAWIEAEAVRAQRAGDGAKAALLRGMVAAATAPPVKPLVNGHAHNDYEHARPLLDALEHGFCSIEVDVFVVDGDLFVAHDAEDLTPERSLRALYLDPLLERVRENNGRVYADGPPVILLVDVKSDAEETYAVLRLLLTEYGEMLTAFTDDGIEERAVRVILSGNRPTATVAAEPRRLVAIDGRQPDLDDNPPVSLMPLVSMPWHTIARVRRDVEEIPEEALERVRAFSAQVHAQGRLARLWAAPENPDAWDKMLDAGLDLINIDDLAAFREFMEGR